MSPIVAELFSRVLSDPVVVEDTLSSSADGQKEIEMSRKRLEDLDFRELSGMVEFFRISTKGLNNLDEITNKLREHLEGLSTRQIGETHQVISDAGKLDTQKRETLQNLYIKTEKFLGQLDTEFIQILEKSWGNHLKTTLEESIKQVAPRDQYVVLVAGETSAGKSSVINLILGEDILPHALLSTTSTICELKHGVKPAIHIHFQDSGTRTREPIIRDLADSADETILEQINNFVNLREDRDKTPYKKIELFLPHPLLKEKVMIVDSPGIGESDVMSEFVLNYLPRAFCFMYVINSENAGGVQEDRLGKLLTCARSKLPANDLSHLSLFTGCALFVCNKWDRIKPEEEEEVKKDQIAKLSKKLVNLDPKSQVVYLSCTTSQKAQSYGYVTEDFNHLITGINNLLVSSMQNNLQMYYRWLEDLVSRVERQIKIFLKSTRMSRQETDEKIQRVMSRMKELQISQQRKFDELSEFQSRILHEIILKLTVYFQAEDTAKQFCKWSPSEAPQAKETWQETKSEVLNCISQRTQQFVQHWEDEEHEFAKAQVSLTKYCCEKYLLMEEEIRQVEEEFDDVKQESVEQEVPKHEEVTATKSRAKSQRKFTETTPVWLRQGLASVVVDSPLGWFGAKIKKKLHYKSKLGRYTDDPCDYMSRRSRKCLKVIATQDRLLPFINKQLDDAVQFLKQIKDSIPKLLESDEKLYEKLLEDDRSSTQVQKIFQPLDRKVESLKRELTVYNLTEMRKSDFTDDELKWDGNFKSIIGNGSFSTVYRGALTREGEPEVKVALKVYRDPLTTRNVWHFVDEERALRQLNHPDIVKYFGTNLRHGSNGTTVMIVLELCKCSLKKEIMSQPQNAPANDPKVVPQKKVLVWALQILDALRYIHSEGFVHRDLKLENLLLTHDGNVKLADVGVAKHEKDITGTICGTSLYLAPEVFEGQIYNSKADMYSFGFVLWELWYGKTAFEDTVVSTSQSVLLEDVRRGLRPTHIDGTTPPRPEWKEVMESCWQMKPSLRLDAKVGRECFKQLQKYLSTPPTPPPKKPQAPRQRPRSHAFESSDMPKPTPRPRVNSTRPSVRFCPKTEEASVHFDSKEKE